MSWLAGIFHKRFSMSLLLGMGIVLLSGCSSTSMDDLLAEVSEIKQTKKAPIEPLPEFKAAENFAYVAGELGDPFEPWQDKMAKTAQAEATKGDGLTPDLERRREALEAFPLDTLRMVGILERESERSALIRSPEGFVSRVTVGNYLGQNHGRVTEVKAEKVEIMEIVPDGLGGWQYRTTSMALAE